MHMVCVHLPPPQPLLPTSPIPTFRRDGLAGRVLAALAKARAGRDPVLALAGGVALLALAQGDAHPAFLASRAAALLTEQLLAEHTRPHGVARAAAESPAGARLQRLLQNGSLLRPPSGAGGSQQPDDGSQQQWQWRRQQQQQQQRQQQQQQQRHSPSQGADAAALARFEALTASHLGPVLAALAQAMAAHDPGRLQYADAVRQLARRHGVLDRLAALLRGLAPAACAAAAGGGHGDGGGSGADAWLLAAALAVLENATFTSPDNAASLAGGGGGGGNGGADGGGDGVNVAGGSGAVAAADESLPALLVSLLPALCAATLDGDAACAQSLQGCLALLMNLTHGAAGGGASAIARAGGAQAIVAVVQRLLPGWREGTPAVLRAQVREVPAGRPPCCCPAFAVLPQPVTLLLPPPHSLSLASISRPPSPINHNHHHHHHHHHPIDDNQYRRSRTSRS